MELGFGFAGAHFVSVSADRDAEEEDSDDEVLGCSVRFSVREVVATGVRRSVGAATGATAVTSMDEKETSASAGTLIGSCASAADAFPVNEETSTAARLSSEAETAGIAAVASIPVDSAVITAPRPIGAALAEIESAMSFNGVRTGPAARCRARVFGL